MKFRAVPVQPEITKKCDTYLKSDLSIVAFKGCNAMLLCGWSGAYKYVSFVWSFSLQFPVKRKKKFSSFESGTRKSCCISSSSFEKNVSKLHLKYVTVDFHLKIHLRVLITRQCHCSVFNSDATITQMNQTLRQETYRTCEALINVGRRRVL